MIIWSSADFERVRRLTVRCTAIWQQPLDSGHHWVTLVHGFKRKREHSTLLICQRAPSSDMTWRKWNAPQPCSPEQGKGSHAEGHRREREKREREWERKRKWGRERERKEVRERLVGYKSVKPRLWSQAKPGQVGKYKKGTSARRKI